MPPSPPEEEATSELVYLGNRLLDDKGVNIDDQYGGFVADDNAYGMNMIRYLLAMQTRGYDVKEFVINQVTQGLIGIVLQYLVLLARAPRPQG